MLGDSLRVVYNYKRENEQLETCGVQNTEQEI